MTTFCLTHAPDLLPVVAEINRVLVPEGRPVVVDVGPPMKPRLCSPVFNSFWRLLGDYSRDETPVLEKAGFEVIYRRIF